MRKFILIQTTQVSHSNTNIGEENVLARRLDNILQQWQY